ncbi:hypothetical protein ACVWYQ_003477 [Bradyrhizobium sp. USDA 3397]
MSSSRLRRVPNQLAAKGDLVAVAAGKPLLRQHVDPPIERRADLRTKAGPRDIDGFTSDQAPVEPGRPFRRHLLVKIEVRADGQRDPLPAPCILEAPHLHDAADGSIASRIEVRQLQMMHAAIDAVDDREGGAPEFIIEPASDEATDHGFAVAFTFECPGRRSARGAIPGKALVQPLDNVATLAKLSQALLCICRQHPARRTGWVSQAELLEFTHPSDPHFPQRVSHGLPVRSQVNDPVRRPGLPGQHPVEPRPAFDSHLCLETLADFKL